VDTRKSLEKSTSTSFVGRIAKLEGFTQEEMAKKMGYF
jgi:hypothetical protein